MPVGARRREGIRHPSGRVVDQNVDMPESLFGGIEQQRGCSRVRQVSLHRQGSAAACPNRSDDPAGVLAPVISISRRRAGIDWIMDPQEGTQHRAAALRERRGGRCADAVIGTGHNRCMTPARLRRT